MEITAVDVTHPDTQEQYTWIEWMDLLVILTEAGVCDLPRLGSDATQVFSVEQTRRVREAWLTVATSIVIEVFPDDEVEDGYRMEPHLPDVTRQVLVHPAVAVRAHIQQQGAQISHYQPAPIGPDGPVPRVAARATARYRGWVERTTRLLSNTRQLQVSSACIPF